MPTIEELNTAQQVFGSGVSLDDGDLPSDYMLITVPVKSLSTDDGKRVTIHNWIEARGNITINGKLWRDVGGIAIIKKLMARYKAGLPVYPMIVTKGFIVVDGYHRLAALNTLNIEKVEVYYPV